MLRDDQLDIARPARIRQHHRRQRLRKIEPAAAIVGLDNDYRGEIRLDDLRILSAAWTAASSSRTHRPFPWMTVEENVTVALDRRPLGRGRRRSSIAENLALVNLSGFEEPIPTSCRAAWPARRDHRALINEPKVLLLGQRPFGALDALKPG